jgi:hypothetical protein
MGQSSHVTSEMYILIDPTFFHLNIAPTTATPAYAIKYNPEGIIVPYMRKEKSTIDVNFSWLKTTLKHGKISIKHAMTRSMCT